MEFQRQAAQALIDRKLKHKSNVADLCATQPRSSYPFDVTIAKDSCNSVHLQGCAVLIKAFYSPRLKTCVSFYATKKYTNTYNYTSTCLDLQFRTRITRATCLTIRKSFPAAAGAIILIPENKIKICREPVSTDNLLDQNKTL